MNLHGVLRCFLFVCVYTGWGSSLWATEQPQLAAAPGEGTSYFVDSRAGSDSYSGLSAEPNPGHTDGPFRTIGVAYGKTQPGDSIMVKEGLYRETVTLSKRASASRPITVRTFPGDEGKVVISGAESIQDWAKCESQAACGGNPQWRQIFYADVDFEVEQLFQGSSLLAPSRVPNEGWFYPTQVSQDNPSAAFIDAALRKEDGYFAGSTCHIKTRLWSMDHIQVDTYSARDASITLVSPTRYEISPSFGYYLTNIVAEINEEGEWAYDRSQRRLYLWPVGGSPQNIEAGFREYGITTSRNCTYHVIQGFVVERAAVGIQLYRASHMTVTDNTIDYSYRSGIVDDRSSYSSIVNNTVRYANSAGISDSSLSSNDLIQGNHVYATGAEYPGDDLVNGVGEAIVVWGSHARCINNRVERSSYNGISVAWGATAGREIAYNYVTESCLSLSDGAGIYTGSHSDSAELDYYHHNIVNDVWGCLLGWAPDAQPGHQCPASCRGEAHGIYLDERGNNRVFERNTALNCGASGVFFHWTQSSSLIDNVLYGNGLCQLLLSGGGDSLTFLRDNSVQGNLLVATAANQNTFRLELEYLDVGFGASDWNVFFHPQSDKHLALCQYRSVGLVGTPYSLHDWRDLTGQEQESTDLSATAEHPSNLENPVIFINPSMDTRTVDLGGAQYLDAHGQLVEGALSIDPFESVVLFPYAGTARMPPGQ